MFTNSARPVSDLLAHQPLGRTRMVPGSLEKGFQELQVRKHREDGPRQKSFRFR